MAPIQLGKLLLKSFRSHIRRLKAEANHRERYPGLTLKSPILFTVPDPSALVVGDNVIIEAFSEIFVIRETPESPLPGFLTIGDHTEIGSFANIRAAGGSISIGAHCLLAQHVSIIASNHARRTEESFVKQAWRTDKAGVTIGNGVWIGTGAIILPGVTIGDNAIIGAGSVVTKNVPSGQTWAGNPARMIRAL